VLRRARTLVFAGGKGGVGTSNLVLNLGLALGAAGHRTLVVDADWGRANLDMLCGIAPRCDLGDVLSGERRLDEALVKLACPEPGRVRLLPGAHGVRTAVERFATAPRRLAEALGELAWDEDYLLVDAGSGQMASVAALAHLADEVVVVTTPEPTAVADAHAALAWVGRLDLDDAVRLRTLVNQTMRWREAQDCQIRLQVASRQFQGLAVTPLGEVRHDPSLPRAVRQRRPLLREAPQGRAARDLRELAGRIEQERQPRLRSPRLAELVRRWWPREAARVG
jgi:flagellar biosynthesis protein FlhG